MEELNQKDEVKKIGPMINLNRDQYMGIYCVLKAVKLYGRLKYSLKQYSKYLGKIYLLRFLRQS